ncbi:TPA: VOC family protein [Streptococcus pneumoniae]
MNLNQLDIIVSNVPQVCADVEDVDQNYKRLNELGIKVLHGPTVTDWGTESLLVQGPAGLVLDFYRMK